MNAVSPGRMQLLRLLSQVSLLRLTTAICASALSGFAAMGATICVIESLRSGNVLWWEFAIVALLAVAIGRYSRAALGELAAKSIVRLRRRMIRSVLRMPLIELERIGTTRLLTAFTGDLFSIGSAVRNLASLFAAAAFLLACLGYIGWLSLPRMIVTALLFVVCVAGAVFLRWIEKSHRHSARETWDKVIHIYNTVLDGVKELKLNARLARRALVSFEDSVREQQHSLGRRSRQSDTVETWIQVMFYVILGVAVFAPFGDRMQLKLSYGVLALLQIRVPLRSLIVDTRAFADASVALQRTIALGLTFSGPRRQPPDAEDRRVGSRSWRRLELEGVTFSYGNDPIEDNFVLGPLDAVLHRGEIVFVAGENGSGKTTLAKVLTGLYRPSAGSIQVDGVAVHEGNAQWYRSNFVAVFGDFCLLEGIVDLKREDAEHAEELAVWLKLNRWATPDPAGQPKPLSPGERRRIALLMAMLQDRSIYVFDEWAADQDPQYKDFFYNEVLSRLRDAGKLVVVISHDEGYFHIADRVLWLGRRQLPNWRSPLSFDRSAAAS
jgi:putative pyoverdin transport system ATP-binding/permease protein